MGNVIRALALMLLSASVWGQGVLEHPVDTPAERERLAAIAERLHRALPVRGQLVQEKHMSILHEPLISRGEFRLGESGDIHWHIREPFTVRYRVEGNQITREIDGQRETITAAGEPSVYGFFQIVGRLFELKLEALTAHFEVYLAPPGESEGQWDMALVPKSARLQNTIARILVSGERARIVSVIVAEPGDDYTDIRFEYPPASED